ncbi:hypothetical protein VNO77_03207 [Canavalia gladiata]|uniref:Uncharacterized protein n=1 Tax=Canavalia gladiata TaxID=3824 RepID=A0AAN9R6P4_CANGL
MFRVTLFHALRIDVDGSDMNETINHNTKILIPIMPKGCKLGANYQSPYVVPGRDSAEVQRASCRIYNATMKL